MRLNAVKEPIGCLLIGETMRMQMLRERLNACGVDTVFAPRGEDLLSCVQEGLYRARRPGGAGIAAEGEMWAAALALSAQLSVDRVVLIEPTDQFRNPKNEWEKQVVRLKGFVRRNLFFCVSDVLMMESGTEKTKGWMDLLCRRMYNARVWRAAMEDQRWTKYEHSQIDAAARFLSSGDFMFTLAK